MWIGAAEAAPDLLTIQLPDLVGVVVAVSVTVVGDEVSVIFL